jgi:hypothetical protein
MNPWDYPERGDWRVASVVEGKKVTGASITRRTALRTMQRLLRQGTPAWLTYDPYFNDDDIPF